LMATAVDDVSARRQLVYSALQGPSHRQTLTLDLPSLSDNTTRATVASEVAVNVLIPTKAYDMRFVLRNEQPILKETSPQELHEYCSKTESGEPSLPPVELLFNGTTYYLTSFHEKQMSRVHTSDQALCTVVGNQSDLLTGETDSCCSVSAVLVSRSLPLSSRYPVSRFPWKNGTTP